MILIRSTWKLLRYIRRTTVLPSNHHWFTACISNEGHTYACISFSTTSCCSRQIISSMRWSDTARVQDLASMVLVGALWGCTNPILRQGSVEAEKHRSARSSSPKSFLQSSLMAFLNFRVWLPYLLNQSGSIVFYVLLANSDLSLAVPICNALALVFSFVTSGLLGESIDKPVRSFLGAALVLVGVTICVSSQGQEGGKAK